MTELKENFFKPVPAKRNSEYVASQIEEAIMQKVYTPNDKLPPERGLATQFNVGRGAIREALRMLDASGYIEVKHGGDGGAYVKELDSTRIIKSVIDLVRIGNVSLQEVTELRVLVESAIIESIFKSTRSKAISELEQNIESCEKLIGENKSIFGEFQKFHIILSSFCKNRLYHHILVSLVEIIDTYVVEIKDPIGHMAHHKMILAAIKKGDRDESKKLLVSHLSEMSKVIKQHIDNSISKLDPVN